jgi:hypothetical protein
VYGEWLLSSASRAVEAARAALPLLQAGPLLWRRGPHGVAVDVVVLYRGAAVDRMHFDPCEAVPLPRGLPEPPGGCREPRSVEELRESAERALRELHVLGAAEYRGPERAWAVPVAWRSLLVMHLRVRVGDGGAEVVPDEALTLEAERAAARGF